MGWPASPKQQGPELGAEAGLKQANEDRKLMSRTATGLCSIAENLEAPSCVGAGACLQLSVPGEPAGEPVP